MSTTNQAKPWANEKAVKHYDLSAEEIAKMDGDQTWFFMSRLVARKLSIGSSLLDVGCAAGSLFALLTQRGGRMDYTGIDITPQLIQAARQRYPQADFKVASACDIPFADQSFDVVFSKGTTFVTQDSMLALSQTLRVAKKCVIADFVLNLPGEPDQVVQTPDRGQVHLLGHEGITKISEILKGYRVSTNILSVGLPQRQGLHPAYQKMKYLKHLVLCAEKESM